MKSFYKAKGDIAPDAIDGLIANPGAKGIASIFEELADN